MIWHHAINMKSFISHQNITRFINLIQNVEECVRIKLIQNLAGKFLVAKDKLHYIKINNFMFSLLFIFGL